MSYSADDHKAFSRRMQKLMLRIQAIRDEAKKLVEIYFNESAYGAAPEFVDTAIASKQEHIDAVVYCGQFADFHEDEAVVTADRTQVITPFVQVD